MVHIADGFDRFFGLVAALRYPLEHLAHAFVVEAVQRLGFGELVEDFEGVKFRVLSQGQEQIERFGRQSYHELHVPEERLYHI